MGGTGCGCRSSVVLHQSNCGVLSAGICTMVRCTSQPSCSSSLRSASVKPRMANLLAQ
jgi:hypothetical protein